MKQGCQPSTVPPKTKPTTEGTELTTSFNLQGVRALRGAGSEAVKWFPWPRWDVAVSLRMTEAKLDSQTLKRAGRPPQRQSGDARLSYHSHLGTAHHSFKQLTPTGPTCSETRGCSRHVPEQDQSEPTLQAVTVSDPT